MAPSNAPRTGRGSFSSNGRYARRSHDAGEDALFALSLDDVMDDRPWTADEPTGSSVWATGDASQAAPRPASDPSETAAFLAAAAQRYTPSGASSHAASTQPAATPASDPVAAPAAPTPSPRPATVSGISSKTVAMPAMAEAAAAQRPAASEVPDPATLEPPVMDLDDLSNRQFAFDSWAATDLDETSAGMPALDVPVNPLYAGPEPDASDRHDDALTGAFDGGRANERIETEDYGMADDYPADPFAPAPEYTAPVAYADAAPAYEESTAEGRFADYYVEEEPPHFSQFSQTAKIAFIAIVVALLGLIGFEGFQLFHGATKAESEVQQKEDENTDYLDINTLKGDPNEGSGE